MKGLVGVLILACITGSAQESSNCSYWNQFPTTLLTMNNLNDHSRAPGHSLQAIYFGKCSYVGTLAGKPCTEYCDDTAANITTTENLATVSPIYYWANHHKINYSMISGSNYSYGGTMSCGSTIAVAGVGCLIPLPCTATVTISASYNGIGTSVSFPPGTIWPDSDVNVITCEGEHVPQGTVTPIIIDLGGGYRISLLKDGVPFNFWGTGLVQVSWPEAGADNGFLVLPDKDGMVPTAHQMFGNQDGYSNGFLQLAQYDSNGDGRIDIQDPIYNDLRVWVDRNRNGVSESGELHTLSELGIESISLQYTKNPYIDPNGNAFRFKGSIILDRTGTDRKVAIYDVFLQARFK